MTPTTAVQFSDGVLLFGAQPTSEQALSVSGGVLTGMSFLPVTVAWSGDLTGTGSSPTVAKVLGVTPSAFILTLLDDADASTARTTLGALGGSLGSTDNSLLRADGTGGFTAQGTSGVVLSDSNELSGARQVRAQRIIVSSPDTQLSTDDLLYFGASLTVDLLTSVTTGREFTYACTADAVLTFDPGGSDTVDDGGAGVAKSISCTTGASVRLVRSGTGTWRCLLWDS